MRVRVYGEGNAEFGEKRFEVSWWVVKKSVLDDPEYQSGNRDFDHDRDQYEQVKRFKSKATANAYAQHVANTHDDLSYGSVLVQEQVVDWFVEEDRIAEWRDVGDSEEFTAELAHA